MHMDGQTKVTYDNLDGLRTIAAIAILAMHVLVIGEYDTVHMPMLSHAGVFVQLFFVLSGFGLCCGYYDRFRTGHYDLDCFFQRRISRAWPFFSLMVGLDILSQYIFSPPPAFSEIFGSLTLLFGFLPGADFDLMGIGWSLGVICAFYFLFPFVVYLLYNKKRAWISLLITIVIGYLCSTSYLVGEMPVSANVMRWLCWFLAGGVIYLYRTSLERIVRNKWFALLLQAMGFFVVFVLNFAGGYGYSMMQSLIGFSMMLIGSIGQRQALLSNRATKYISEISMEIYLCHVAIFRVIQKFGFDRLHDNEFVSFIIAFMLTLGLSVIFARCYKIAEGQIRKRYTKY